MKKWTHFMLGSILWGAFAVGITPAVAAIPGAIWSACGMLTILFLAKFICNDTKSANKSENYSSLEAPPP